MQKLDTMIDCLILALNGNFKMNIMFLSSINSPCLRLYEWIDINHLLLDSLTSQHFCTESYIDVIIWQVF